VKSSKKIRNRLDNRWWDSPILNRELRSLMRSHRSFLWLLLFLGIMLITFTTAWPASADQVRSRDILSRKLFTVVVVSEGLLFSLLAPILTSGSLSGEHERRTFLLLATTPLSGYHVALAKCFSALAYLLLLVVASIPLLAITFMLGGVGGAEVIASTIVILATVSVAGMTGVAVSAWIRRTLIALMVSIVLVVTLTLTVVSATATAAMPVSFIFIRPFAGASGSESAVILAVAICYAVIQGFVFLGLLRLAHNGYIAGAHTAPVRPKRLIKSKIVIKERRRRFPYYLIDPLKAPEPIPDGANPMYVRDKRHQPLGRLDFVIRLSYICLVSSIFIGLSIISTSQGYTMNPLSNPMNPALPPDNYFLAGLIRVSYFIVFILVAAAPLYASMAFTNEKEQETFVPMMATLVTPSKVLWAKLAIILRYSGIFIAAMLIPAWLICCMASDLGGNPGGGFNAKAAAEFCRALLWISPFYIVVTLAFAMLGLWISASSRRNVGSLTVTYLTVFFVCVGPSILMSILDPVFRYHNPNNEVELTLVDVFGYAYWGLEQLSVFLSPFRFLAGGNDRWVSAIGCYHDPAKAAVYLALWTSIIAALYLGTLRALDRSVTGPHLKRA
jgi:ABC-type transport system involved in multi-copper enzyme maturation permease subunit